ncbi:MAG: MerR family transcriptional regulator [Thermodesulfobacteriota bacterium]|nr:MerR family transcriptional regulator [Thermodesulfobacteriota bacterium]
MQDRLSSIQEVSALLKVPKPTLRFWEKELEGILVPLRTDGGQRRYTVENIVVIDLLRQCASTAREIKKLKRKGVSLPEIKRKLGKGQMPEAGSQRTGDERTGRIDLLAVRVAEVVRAEVNRFFEGVKD